jgi:hypothetical protein
MKAVRVLLFLPGLAAIGWGLWLAVEFTVPINPQSFFVTGWVLAGPVIHDGLIAPLVGLTGLVLSRVVSIPWRGPLIIGAVLSGILTLLAIPLLWRTYGAAPLPGLHDGNTLRGLLISLAVVWLAVVASGFFRQHQSKRHRNRQREQDTLSAQENPEHSTPENPITE